MKGKLSYLVALIGAAVMFCACSGIQRIVNTGDADIIYEHALNYYNAEKWSKALHLLQTCRPYLNGSFREDTVAFYIARSNFKLYDYMTASEQLDEFRRTYGRSVFKEQAEAMYAISLYNMCPSPERDQTMTGRAITAISEYMTHYPESEQMVLFSDMTDDLVWRLHEKAFLNAYTYYKIERYDSAIIAFRNAIKKYPESHRREDLMYYTTMSAYKLAESSIEQKQLDRYMTALDSYYSFVMEFPESKYKKEMDKVAEESKRFIERNDIESDEAPADPTALTADEE